MPLKLTTYYRGKDIPDLPGNNTFHSKELFQIYEMCIRDSALYELPLILYLYSFIVLSF